MTALRKAQTGGSIPPAALSARSSFSNALATPSPCSHAAMPPRRFRFGRLGSAAVRLVDCFRPLLLLHEPRQVLERLSPAQHGSLEGDLLRYSFLHDPDFRAAGDVLERDRDLDLALHGRVLTFEFVCVMQTFVGLDLEEFAAEEVGVPLVEGRETHPVCAPDFGLELVHVCRVPVRWHPLG